MSSLGEALAAELFVRDVSGARPAWTFRGRPGFHRRSARLSPLCWSRFPSGSLSLVGAGPWPGLAFDFTSTALVPVGASPPGPEPSGVRDVAPEGGKWPVVQAPSEDSGGVLVPSHPTVSLG